MSLTRENIDIYQYPAQIHTLTSGSAKTLGDLDGNTAKAIFLLLNEGIITMSKNVFDQLIEIYRGDPTKAENIDKFNRLLAEVQVNKPAPKLRIIGDDLADRGKSDLLTLLLYKKLDDLGVETEVIASNHGREFLRQYMAGLNNELVLLYKDNYSNFGSSYYGLRNSEVSPEEVESLIQQHYLEKIKLLSYEIKGGSISIYSHAPVHPAKLKNLSDYLGVEYNDKTPEELGNTIDKINAVFLQILKEKNVVKLNHQIIDDVVNDRYEDLAKQLQNNNQNNQQSYQVMNIHGHVSSERLGAQVNIGKWQYVNLDGALGKSEVANKGQYAVFITQASPKLEEKASVAAKSTASVPAKPMGDNPVTKKIDALRTIYNKPQPIQNSIVRFFAPKNYIAKEKSILDNKRYFLDKLANAYKTRNDQSTYEIVFNLAKNDTNINLPLLIKGIGSNKMRDFLVDILDGKDNLNRLIEDVTQKPTRKII